MTQPTRAADFIGSLGVNTHLDFGSYGYQNLAVVEQAINYLGLHNLRDSAATSADLTTWNQVAQATGAKFDDYIGETSPAGMSTYLNLMPQLAAEGILNFIEGGNEEDDSYPASLGNTLQFTAQFQQQVYAMGQQLGLAVINISFGSGWTAANNWQGNYGAVGNLAAYATYGNAHTYPVLGQTPDMGIQRLNGLALLADSSDPVITTEIGWDLNNGFTQQQVATYVLDAAMDGLKDGDTKMYFYALFNDGSGAFGLMNQDGSPTPAGKALHNLTTLLSDNATNASSFTPGSLNYTLSGTTSGDSQVLIEKADGSFWLSLWNETEAAGSPHNVTLNLQAAAEVKVFDPLTGTTAISDVLGVTGATISLPDHPVLVEIMPSAAVPTPTPTPAPTPTPTPTPSPTPTPTPTPTATSTTVTLDPSSPNAVITQSSISISGTGSFSLFIGGTHDKAVLKGGTEQVQAYQGYNNITTAAGNDTIRIAGTHNVVNAGAGNNMIADSGSGNRIVLPGAGHGFDSIFGYVLQNNDTLDFRSALKGTAWDGTQSSVGQFVHVSMSGADAQISISATAGGSGSLVATLHGSGPETLASITPHSIF